MILISRSVNAELVSASLFTNMVFVTSNKIVQLKKDPEINSGKVVNAELVSASLVINVVFVTGYRSKGNNKRP